MISYVIPVYNEEESLPHFYAELTQVAKKIKGDYEIIFVDDGSNDGSFSLLRSFEEKDKRVRVFSHRCNLGKAEALSLGFERAEGEIIVTLDADLQDQPTEIPSLIAMHKQGFDVVCGWRKNRKDASKMKLISRLFNYTLNKVFELNIHDYNCGLKLYTRDAAKSLHLYGGMHRFIPILVYKEGFTIAELPVRHEVRKFGESKYKFSKIKDLPDVFTMLFLIRYMKKPLHFFGAIGGGVFFLGFIILFYLTSLKVLLNQSIGGRPLLFLGILSVVVGAQIFFTGFLAELIINLSYKQGNSEVGLKYPRSK